MAERQGSPGDESRGPVDGSVPVEAGAPKGLSDVRLSELVPALDGLLFLLDPAGRILDYRTGPTAELFVEPERFLGRALQDVLPNPVAAAFFEVLRGERAGPWRTEYVLPYPGGNRAFEANFARLPDGHWAAFVQHVTDRARTEHELRASESRLREAVRVAGTGFVDHDHVTDVIYWSPEQRRLWGWTADEPVTLEKIARWVHPDDVARSQAAVKQAHDPAGDGRFDIDFRVRRPDGRIRWLSTRSQTFFAGVGADRRPVRTIGATIDITERVLSERALRESEERFRALIEEGLDLVLTLGEDSRVTFASPAVQTVLGWEPDELVGRPLLELAHPDDLDAILAARARLRSGQQDTFRGVARLRHRAGGYRVLDGIVRDLRRNPAVAAWVVNARDITEQRRLEEHLQQAERLDSIGRLAGGIAHDFNNLLTAVLGYSELLQAQIRSARPVRLEDVQEIRAAAERARELTTQLLAFARRQVIAPRRVDLNEVLRTSERMLKRLLGPGVALSTELESDLWPILVDPTQLHQVILNLAINARDAMQEGGRLTLATANVALDETAAAACGENVTPGEYVRLAAIDSGAGIPASVLPHIFEPFYTTKGPGKGTGLGLATVYGIVRQSTGHIEVYSEPGSGTRFEVFFPRASHAGPEDVGVPEPSREPAAGSETVLVVEDDAAVRGFTARSLSAAGYRVLVAAAPEPAIELARQTAGPLHLLVTDVVMPGMGGRDLAERLLRERPSLRVLFVSGYARDAVAPHGELDEGVHFLAKPFTATELRGRVRDLLDGHARPGLGR